MRASTLRKLARRVGHLFESDSDELFGAEEEKLSEEDEQDDAAATEIEAVYRSRGPISAFLPWEEA